MLAKNVVAQAKAWLGKNEKDGSFKEILDTYNQIKPLPRGYRVKVSDSWCAAYVSAVFFKCGANDFPFECSCGKMIELAQGMGIWVENDAHVPAVGDIIMYDWNDSGNGDNTGWAKHVGIVESVYNGLISVIEGNNHDAVEYRAIEVNGKTIRGYICPKYESNESEVKPMRYFKLTEGMNIRKTPNGTKVGAAPMGTIVSGTELATNNGLQWLKTSYNGIEGYIAVLPASKGYAVEIDAPKKDNEAERLKNAIKEAIKILSEVV